MTWHRALCACVLVIALGTALLQAEKRYDRRRNKQQQQQLPEPVAEPQANSNNNKDQQGQGYGDSKVLSNDEIRVRQRWYNRYRQRSDRVRNGRPAPGPLNYDYLYHYENRREEKVQKPVQNVQKPSHKFPDYEEERQNIVDSSRKYYSAKEGLDYYCYGLSDGSYYDPWNPYCGFITCKDGKPLRECCKKAGGVMDILDYKRTPPSWDHCYRMQTVTPPCSVGLDYLDFCKHAHKVDQNQYA